MTVTANCQNSWQLMDLNYEKGIRITDGEQVKKCFPQFTLHQGKTNIAASKLRICFLIHQIWLYQKISALGLLCLS
ncbi:hypothetical protein GWI33_000599 [Rhynchophorus ferrugineus]|uniref:Uncharacterized protein n=1 Tax=Rhynchophorus ferrugineus TaxID=354439 RepID=A0A834HZ90_RHYFE|nr:hypothetical protein GWI33_000599 [Rhynchophorus ferrugineus]